MSALLEKSVFIVSMAAMAAWNQTTGPGIPQITWPASDLYRSVATINMPVQFDSAPAAHGVPFGNNLVSMHRGYMFVFFAPDHMLPGGGFRFYNMSNPRSPQIVYTHMNRETQINVEAHGYGASTFGGNDYFVFQADSGIQFWNFTNIMAPRRVRRMYLPTISGGGYDGGVFGVSWQGRHAYTASSSHGIHIVDAADPANPIMVRQLTMSQTGGFRVGLVFAIGNILVASVVGLAGDGGGAGFTIFDISDPGNPSVLSTSRAFPAPYATLPNGNRLYMTGLDGRLHIINITNPRAPVLDRSSAVMSPAHGEYLYIQDQYVMHANEDGVHKLDLNSNLAQVGLTMTSPSEAQEGHPVPLGNYLVIGDDHAFGSGIVPHDTLPDTRGPAVNMVVPADNAVNQAVTSRVGITMTDQVDLASVNAGSFIVRELGGAQVPGRYAAQQQIVNFSPDVNLKPNTVYEVIIPQNGIRDWSGNPTGTTFQSRFTTNNQAVLTPIPASSMTATASSQNTGYEAPLAIDGNINTIWHTNYQPPSPLPQDITLTFDRVYDLRRFTYTPRQDGNNNGTITQYEIWLSSDGTNFTLLTQGNWAADATPKSVGLSNQARAIRLRALAGINNFASASEFSVEYLASPVGVKPLGKSGNRHVGRVFSTYQGLRNLLGRFVGPKKAK